MGTSTPGDTNMEEGNLINKKQINGHVKSDRSHGRRPSSSRQRSSGGQKKTSHAVRRSKSQATLRSNSQTSDFGSDLSGEAADVLPDNIILNEIKRGANGMEGLFQRKRSSINMLTDPRILDHLRKIHHEAKARGSTSSTDTINSQIENDQLDEKVSVYNRKMQLGVFQLRKNSGLFYEGALRFYYEDHDQELTKAIRVKSTTTVAELIPVLLDKFNLRKMDEGEIDKREVYEVVNGDEILLDKDERPLELALNAKSTPRFVLSEGPPSSRRNEINTTNSHVSDLESSLNLSVNSGDLENTISPAVRRRNKNKTKQERAADRQKRRTWTGGFDDDSMETSSVKTCPEMSPSAQLIANRRGRSLKKNKNDSGERKRARSASRNRLSFRFSFRKSKEVEEISDRTELSIEDRAPGILKIFGESVVPGANYKSVLATNENTASEIVKQSLERYNLPPENSYQFVLCDVVGRFRNPTNDDDKPEWVTEHVRVIPNNERPMVLQSLWKPQGGLCRRFELMEKSAVAADGGFVDINDNTGTFGSPVSSTTSGSGYAGRNPSNAITNDSASLDGYIIQPCQRLSGTTVSNATSSVNSGCELPVRPPSQLPFFLTLRGYNSCNDYVLYTISDNAAMIGSDQIGNHTVDICLTAPDILPQHCWVCKKPAEKTTDLDAVESPVVITLAPLVGAAVYVNNKQITSVSELCPGDLVAMGEHYVFLFKDPTISSEIPRNLNWLSPRKSDTERRRSLVELLDGVDHETDADVIRNQHRAETLEEWEETRKRECDEAGHTCNRLKISYEHDREDNILEQCVTIMNPLDEGFPLTPAYLLCLCVEYSAVKFTQHDTRNLLLKISSLVQSAAWERTKDLASRQTENAKFDDNSVYLHSLLSDIQPIIFWMANGLEMLHFFQCNLSTYITEPHLSLPVGTRESLVGADNEVVAVLEEVVMYTFQQTVYYLTKTLYMVLATTLDSNPFTPPPDGSDQSAMTDIIHVFESTYQIVTKYKLHKDIVSQLFCYLFFFTNTSLFNTLMETGAGKKYYSWHKAVQIRANLDILESWAAENGLQEEAENYFTTFSTAINLLATPKHQLLHADWTTLRADFPSLNPAQLQQLLGEYNLGKDKPRPRGWFPPPEEVEPALRKGEIMESFNSHPPLVLPADEFVMDLSIDVSDPTFYEYLNTVNTTYGVSDDDGDSGLCVGHTPSSSPKAETNRMSYSDGDDLSRSFQGDSYQIRSTRDQRPHQNRSQKNSESNVRKLNLKTIEHDQVREIPPTRPPKSSPGHSKETSGALRTRSRRFLHEYVNDIDDDIPYTKVEIHRQPEENEIIISEPPRLPPKQKSNSPVAPKPTVMHSGSSPDVLGAMKTSAPTGNHRTRQRSPTEPPIVPATWESLYSQRKNQRPSTNNRRRSSSENAHRQTTKASESTMSSMPAISVTPAESSRSIPVLGPPLKVSGVGGRQKDHSHYVDVHSALPTSRHVNGLKVMPLTTDDQHPKSPGQLRKTATRSAQSPKSSSDDISELDQYVHRELQLADERLPYDKTPDVFVVDLAKNSKGLGLGLIDGMFTPLRASGIYVRTLVPGAPAHKDGRLKLGDRILAVNGISLVGADYQSAMKHIRAAGENLRFLVAKSDSTVAMKITASTC